MIYDQKVMPDPQMVREIQGYMDTVDLSRDFPESQPCL